MILEGFNAKDITFAITELSKDGLVEWQPILEAARDHDVALCVVLQNAGQIARPITFGRPLIAVVGDSPGGLSLGPDAFDGEGIWGIIQRSRFVIIKSRPLRYERYADAARLAVLTRQDVTLIDTEHEHELAWVQLVDSRDYSDEVISDQGGTY